MDFRSLATRLLQEKGSGIADLVRALTDAETIGFIHIIRCFVEYSRPFPVFILQLAARLANSPCLLYDRHEPIGELRDRSHEVASYILQAAIDEFGVPGDPNRPTHRQLAQQFLRHVVASYPGHQLLLGNDNPCKAAIVEIVAACSAGYGGSKYSFELKKDALSALAFHAMSETLAGQEFLALRESIEKRPKLLSHLQKQKIWHFVTMHCSVEEDHAANAYKALERTVELFHLKKDSEHQVTDAVKKGFSHCLNSHKEFMGHLRRWLAAK